MKVSELLSIYDHFKKLIEHPAFENLRKASDAFDDAVLEFESERLAFLQKGKNPESEISFDEFVEATEPLKSPITDLFTVDVPGALKDDYTMFKQQLGKLSRKYMVPSVISPEEKQETYEEMKQYLMDHLQDLGGLQPPTSGKKSDTATYEKDMKSLREFINNDPQMDSFFRLQASLKTEKGLSPYKEGKDNRELMENFGAAINTRLHEERANSFKRIVSDSCETAIDVHFGQEMSKRQYSDKLIQRENRDLSFFSKSLKDAKTFKNSDSYTKLMKMVSDFSKKDQLPQATSLNKADTQILKYALLKKQIDAYLSHKGQDGVKENAFDKLVAVEELNRYVSDKLSYYQGRELKLNGDTLKIEKPSVTYADARNYSPNAIDGPEPMKHKEIKELSLDATTADATLKSRKLGAINDCMSRIILKAAEEGTKPEVMRSLKQARTDVLKPLEKQNVKVKEQNREMQK